MRPDAHLLAGDAGPEAAGGPAAQPASPCEVGSYPARIFLPAPAVFCGRVPGMGQLDFLPRRRSDLEGRQVDGEILLLDRRGSQIHYLNLAASHIWNSCDGVHSVTDIVEKTTSAFQADRETVTTRVMTTINQFAQAGLLENVDLPTDECAA